MVLFNNNIFCYPVFTLQNCSTGLYLLMINLHYNTSAISQLFFSTVLNPRTTIAVTKKENGL